MHSNFCFCHLITVHTDLLISTYEHATTKVQDQSSKFNYKVNYKVNYLIKYCLNKNREYVTHGFEFYHMIWQT